jgi:hypothetical protein
MNVTTRVTSQRNASTMRSAIARTRAGKSSGSSGSVTVQAALFRFSTRSSSARTPVRYSSSFCRSELPSSRRSARASAPTASRIERRSARRRSRSAAESWLSGPWKRRSNAEAGLVSFASGLCGPAHEMLREYAHE